MNLYLFHMSSLNLDNSHLEGGSLFDLLLFVKFDALIQKLSLLHFELRFNQQVCLAQWPQALKNL